MTQEKLKPCPFCGSGAELSYYKRGADPAIAGYFVECGDCSAGGPSRDIESVVTDAKAEAIAAWNTRPRAATALVDEAGERMVQIIDYVLSLGARGDDLDDCMNNETLRGMFSALSAQDKALREAVNERDLFINPDLLDQAADEIDCCPHCDCITREWDTNHTMCVKADKGEYCPNDLAETLRAIAKVARIDQAGEAK